jgi:general secretion pathway protein D
MLYPSEFDPPQIPQNFGGGGNLTLDPGGNLQLDAAQGSNSFPVTPANPNSFTPRDIGSTIEVEPTVGDDGYTVNLDLSVVFSEFEGFINYGTPITNGEVVLTENRIIQPVFSKTAAAAQVMVYDGETVAIGGLRQEKSETINDKVPVLGSLPVVGRLFKSQVQRDSRKVMIYLVSVNIIDPSGGAATAGARAAEAAEAGPSDADGESILLR